MWFDTLAFRKTSVLLFLALAFCVTVPSLATDYYVDCERGDDDNNTGTSADSPYRTLAKMETIQLHGGDTVRLKRGCVWEESYNVYSANDATSENRIIIEAYGEGPPPTLRGDKQVDLTASATRYTNEIWRVPYTPADSSVTFDFARFDGIYGQQKTSTGDLTEWLDWYWDGTYLYYRTGVSASPTSAVKTVWLPNEQFGIRLATDSYVTVRGIRFLNQRSSAIYLSGSPGFRAEYCEMGCWLRQGNSVGFLGYGSRLYSAHDATFVNCTIYGWSRGIYCGVSGATITITNSLIVGNEKGLEGTSGVTFSYDHSLIGLNGQWNGNVMDTYGSATFTDNGGNIAPEDAWPVFAAYPYPVEKVSLSVDDFCFNRDQDIWSRDVCQDLEQYGGFLDLGCETGWPAYSDQNTVLSDVYATGCRHACHSWSHTYKRAGEKAAFDIQYTGSSSCTLDIAVSGADMTLSTSGCDGNTLSYSLLDSSYDTVKELCDAIDADANYTCTLDSVVHDPCKSTGLADVSGADIQPAAYTVEFDLRRHYRNEVELCYDWLMQQDWDGDPNTRDFLPVMIWPGGLFDEGDIGYSRFDYARGTGSTYDGDVNRESLPSGVHTYGLRCAGLWYDTIIGYPESRKREVAKMLMVGGQIFGGWSGCMFTHKQTWTAQDLRELFLGFKELGVDWVHLDEWSRWIVDTYSDRWSPDHQRFFASRDGVGTLWSPIPDVRSPLVNAGADAGLTEDIRGVRIIADPDIGAYEAGPGISGGQ